MYTDEVHTGGIMASWMNLLRQKLKLWADVVLTENERD